MQYSLVSSSSSSSSSTLFSGVGVCMSRIIDGAGVSDVDRPRELPEALALSWATRAFGPFLGFPFVGFALGFGLAFG